MNKAQSELVISKIESGKSVEDVVTLLVMTDVFETKTLARIEVLAICEEHGLSTKKVSKADGLKEWFLNLDSPLDANPEDIKKECENLGMKGGSVQYYINSYKLAIDLFKQIQGV